MKVVAVMEVSPTDGGGFYQALNAVMQMKRLCEGRYDFAVGVMHPGSRVVLSGLGVDSFALPTSVFDRARFMLSRQPVTAGGDAPAPRKERRTPAWRSRLVQFLRSIPDIVDIERHLVDQGADLVYFVAPWSRVHRFDQLSYWLTIWDLAHVEYVEFPELAGAARVRETVLSTALLRAGVVVADSDSSKFVISHRYGVQADRVVAMSFLPAPNLDAVDRASKEDVLASLDLEPGYLFYPAQFWAHKNHVRILEALRICVDRGQPLRVVFAGRDLGARRHVEATVAALGLRERVRFLGFVDPRAMRGLYEGCSAVVMPTYFGPTNLPPLEAWSIGVPLVYSRHLHGQAGDAAILVDPDDPQDLADALLAVQSPSVRDDLIAKGFLRMRSLAREREDAEHELQDRLRRLEARLRCSRTVGPRPI